jgi:hypothetical protein
MPTLRPAFLLELELEEPLALDPEFPELPHAASVSAAADTTAATFIV